MTLQGGIARRHFLVRLVRLVPMRTGEGFAIAPPSWHDARVKPALLALLVLAAAAMLAIAAPRFQARVVRVIDGDTIVAEVCLVEGMTNKLRVRFTGIDAPEAKTAAGSNATLRVKEWLDGKEIELETTQARDHYGRLLAVPWTGGTNVCELLLREKLAVPVGNGQGKH